MTSNTNCLVDHGNNPCNCQLRAFNEANGKNVPDLLKEVAGLKSENARLVKEKEAYRQGWAERYMSDYQISHKQTIETFLKTVDQVAQRILEGKP